MNAPGQLDRQIQNRIAELFIVKLGYTYLGNWEELGNTSNIEERHISNYLTKQGYDEVEISKAIFELKQAANSYSDDLLEKNKNVYALLHNGVQLKDEAGIRQRSIKLIDWKNWENNDFGIAEEVNIKGNKHKRPDIVLYVNGIALGLLELKRSSADITEGIRQTIITQQGYYIESFFSTIQLVMAGNEAQGLRYGTIKTEEKLYLQWNEAVADENISSPDKYLLHICHKERFLEMIHDGVIFEAGKKKLVDPQQYLALKAARERIDKKEGGIIWHQQGLGKNTLMVLLAKWVIESNANARVIILTDNTELDKQIETLFSENGEAIKRAANSKKLFQLLRQPAPRLICSLAQKFGKKAEDIAEDFMKELESSPVPTDVELFVFVDDCHKPQSSKLFLTMKMLLQKAIFIGFTGTALLKKDKKITMEVFGAYIHGPKLVEGQAHTDFQHSESAEKKSVVSA